MAPSAAETTVKGTHPTTDIVPVLDFSLFHTEEKLQIAKELFAAFKNSGFVYLCNHGVPQEIVDEAFTWVS